MKLILNTYTSNVDTHSSIKNMVHNRRLIPRSWYKVFSMSHSHHRICVWRNTEFNLIDQMDLLMSIEYSTHILQKENSSQQSRTCSNIDHILGHKKISYQIQENEICSYILSDHNRIQIEINSKKITKYHNLSKIYPRNSALAEKFIDICA